MWADVSNEIGETMSHRHSPIVVIVLVSTNWYIHLTLYINCILIYLYIIIPILSVSYIRRLERPLHGIDIDPITKCKGKAIHRRKDETRDILEPLHIVSTPL